MYLHRHCKKASLFIDYQTFLRVNWLYARMPVNFGYYPGSTHSWFHVHPHTRMHAQRKFSPVRWLVRRGCVLSGCEPAVAPRDSCLVVCVYVNIPLTASAVSVSADELSIIFKFLTKLFKFILNIWRNGSVSNKSAWMKWWRRSPYSTMPICKWNSELIM